jgi:hypothetical protein
MTDTIIIAVGIFLGAYTLAFFIYIGFRQNLRLKERQLALDQEVKLDLFRAHMEREVMGLNKEFANDIKRFNEMNHMVLSGQSELSKLKSGKPHQSAFLAAHGISSIDIRPRSIFVLTPFHSDFDKFFQAVRAVGQETDYKVSRGDERVEKSDIFTQVLNGIATTRLVVANITGRNPNVFYELGIAHALDKEVILVAESDVEVPFDLQSKRIIFYDNVVELQQKLVTALARLAND